MQTFTSRDGMNIAYYVDDFTDPWTKPETVLLLHAAMGNSVRWWRWVPPLSRRFRVVRMDLRGHGASQKPRPDEEFSLAHLVGDAVELLDCLKCDSAHIVGSSAGGYLAQQLALHHGNRVKTLALYASTPGLKQSGAPTWIPRIREMGLRSHLASTILERFEPKADPNLVKWFLDQAGSNDPEFISRFVLHMCTHDFMTELDAIRCPTLIVAPAKEQIGHASAYEEMHRRIRDSELVLYETTGHNITDGLADRCVDDLIRFLAARGFPASA